MNIFIPDKKLFCSRIEIDNDIAIVLYDIIISILTETGEVTDNRVDYNCGKYQLFWYNEGFNGKDAIIYKCSVEVVDIIHILIRNRLIKVLDDFAKREMKKGKNLLIQLNRGSITINDFNKSI